MIAKLWHSLVFMLIFALITSCTIIPILRSLHQIIGTHPALLILHPRPWRIAFKFRVDQYIRQCLNGISKREGINFRTHTLTHEHKRTLLRSKIPLRGMLTLALCQGMFISSAARFSKWLRYGGQAGSDWEWSCGRSNVYAWGMWLSKCMHAWGDERGEKKSTPCIIEARTARSLTRTHLCHENCETLFVGADSNLACKRTWTLGTLWFHIIYCMISIYA